MRGIVDGLKNSNGCNVPVTWFTTQAMSDCALVQQLLEENHEIAAHTVHHYELAEALPGLEEEIVGVKKWLVDECKVPADKIRGHRSPFLVHNPKVREILQKNGFEYDSSINEYVAYGSTTTPNLSNRMYPYTMDHGIPQDCAWTRPYGRCEDGERYPNLMEVPMYDLMKDETKGYTKDNIFTMDPRGDVPVLLQYNFDKFYNGNRNFMPIMLHATWGLEAQFRGEIPNNMAGVRKFLEDNLSKPGVFAVTMSQLVDWMKNPVPWQQFQQQCSPVEVQPPVEVKCSTYAVQSGDFFNGIAMKLGIMDTNELLKVNPKLIPTQGAGLKIGDVLRVPPYDDSCPDAPTDPTTPSTPGGTTPTATPAPAPVPEATPAQCRKVKASMGQSIYSLSIVYNTSPQEIEALNNLKPNSTLSFGQEIKLAPYPPCCDEAAGCPVPLPRNRVQVDMNIGGAVDKAAIMSAVSALVGVDGADVLSVENLQTFGDRRLLQVSEVVIAIATADPITTAQKINGLIKSKAFEKALTDVGLVLNQDPVVTAFVNDVETPLPPNDEASTPPADNNNSTETSSSSSGFPLWAIAPIVVGVIAVGAIVGVIIIKKKKAGQHQRVPSGGVTATFSTSKSSSIKGEAV